MATAGTSYIDTMAVGRAALAFFELAAAYAQSPHRGLTDISGECALEIALRKPIDFQRAS
jgi:hypothetical protein